jgi:hypothetical protein
MGGQKDVDTQRQLDALTARLAATDADIAALQAAARQAGHRADRADERTRSNSDRIDLLEDRGVVDREMIRELQAEGLVTREQAGNMRKALESSRMIGAAVGIIMAFYGVTETGAFELLKKASMANSVKLRSVAEDVVLTGSAAGLPPRESAGQGAPGSGDRRDACQRVLGLGPVERDEWPTPRVVGRFDVGVPPRQASVLGQNRAVRPAHRCGRSCVAVCAAC